VKMAKNEVATTAGNNEVVNLEIDALLTEFAGAGTSSDAAHNTIPLVYVLQSNSPQVNKRGDAYLPDAEPGDLWFRNAEKPIVNGTEGVIFQPVHFAWAWVEWRPNRQGFVAAHGERPADAKHQQLDPNDDRLSWVRSNGNIVVETAYVYGLVNCETPYVIPLSSSGFSVARNWNTLARARKHNGKTPPLFATKYRLSTAYRSSDKGDWFVLSVAIDEGFPTKEQMLSGLEFYKSVSSGEKKAEAQQDHTVTETDVPF
jgi:hypothetical protein